MSIGEMQACLARLYVSEPFRQLFYADPLAALGGYKLTSEESKALESLDPNLLDRFASSLVGKRSKQVERAYPLLFALDADEMRRYYWRFYQLYTAKPHHSAHQDVMDFGTFMEESLATAEHLPPYTSDVARYERLYFWAAFATPSRAAADRREPPEPPRVTSFDARPSLRSDVAVADFAYDVGEIEELLQQGRAPDERQLASGRCTIVFRPGTSTSDIQMLRINAPTRSVLDFCDGRRTVSQVVADTESALRATDLKDGIINTIDRLLALEVLSLDPADPVRASAQSRIFGDATDVESM